MVSPADTLLPNALQIRICQAEMPTTDERRRWSHGRQRRRVVGTQNKMRTVQAPIFSTHRSLQQNPLRLRVRAPMHENDVFVTRSYQRNQRVR